MFIHSHFLCFHFRLQALDKVKCRRLPRLEIPSLGPLAAGDGLVKGIEGILVEQ